jgi:hypothetical protein
MPQFCTYSNGSVSITGTDTLSDSWSDNPNGTPYVTQQAIAWSQLEDIHAPRRIDNRRGCRLELPGRAFAHTRTYTPSVRFAFDRRVQEPERNCTFTVEF